MERLALSGDLQGEVLHPELCSWVPSPLEVLLARAACDLLLVLLQCRGPDPRMTSRRRRSSFRKTEQARNFPPVSNWPPASGWRVIM